MCGVWVGEVRWGGEGHFLSLREAYIPSLNLLLCLEAFEKFLVVVVVSGGWWVVEGKFSVQLRLKLNKRQLFLNEEQFSSVDAFCWLTKPILLLMSTM